MNLVINRLLNFIIIIILIIFHFFVTYFIKFFLIQFLLVCSEYNINKIFTINIDSLSQKVSDFSPNVNVLHASLIKISY
jgi:hypothetical protein